MRAIFGKIARNSRISPRLFLAIVLSSLLAGQLPAAAAKGGSGTGGSCKPKHACQTTTDTTAPAVSIASPTSGATVSGTISVTGSSSDNVGISAVDLSVDGGAWHAASGTISWSGSVDTTPLADGTHSVTARATDTSGNRSTTSVAVTVENTVEAPADAEAPTVSITAPADGATLNGTVSIWGSSSDDTSVDKVEVRVDTGTWMAASGTSSWTRGLDTTTYSDGDHTIAARATDAAGNVTTTSRTATFDNSAEPAPSEDAIAATDEVLTNSAVSWDIVLLGRGRAAELGSLSFVLYAEEFGQQPWVHVRDAATGATANVRLPAGTINGQEWTDARYVLTQSRVLWVLSGSGPVFLRKFQLSDEAVPQTATLLSTQTFGDTDSRTGEMILSSSGALIGVWHQQGATGPQGLTVFRLAGESLFTTARLDFMPTKASKQALAQHPADDSLWLFNNPDGWGRNGAVHLTETTTGLKVDWTDPYFIDQAKYGSNGTDPENADLVAAADTATGTIALAYQNATRKIFSTSPVVTGAHVSIARVAASGSVTFTTLPVYVERISRLGLVVRGGATWLAYRPVDQSTLTFDRLHLSRHSNGAWSAAKEIGQLHSPYERLAIGTSRVEFTARLSDADLHRTHAQ